MGPHLRSGYIAQLGECVDQCECDCSFGWRSREGVADPCKEDDEAGVCLSHEEPVNRPSYMSTSRVLICLKSIPMYSQRNISSSSVHGSDGYYESDDAQTQRSEDMVKSFLFLIRMSKRNPSVIKYSRVQPMSNVPRHYEHDDGGEYPRWGAKQQCHCWAVSQCCCKGREECIER